MTGRIGRAFEVSRRAGRLAFVPFLTSGYPDRDESDRLAGALCEEGADVLELGVPFSDPLADGPVIQKSTAIALQGGMTLAGVLEQTRRLRERHATPIVLMSYLNPIVRFGPERFAAEATEAGADGVIAVDLPPEADPALWNAFRAAGLETIVLVSPSTAPERLPSIALRARGYLYVVARLGVTGGGSGDPGLGNILARCRGATPLPRCLGFGIGLDTDLAPVRNSIEGVIVGSALLEAIGAGRDAADREARARAFARALRARLAAPAVA